jgi:protein phosphatase
VVDHPGEDGDGRHKAQATARPPRAPRSSSINARVIAFVVVLVLVLAGAVAAIGWYARGAYYVGLRGQQVAIYKGRPGGLLWFKPTLAQRTDLTHEQLVGDFRAAVESGKEEQNLGAARAYVARLRQVATPAPGPSS